MSTFHGFVDRDGKLTLDHPKAFKAYYQRFAGDEIEIDLRKRRTKRSDRQNRAFWAALTPWAHELGYEPVELKDELLGLLWGYEEVVSKLTGEVRRVPIKGRSSKLTTQEMSELYEFMAVKAAETGYVMELADEFSARKQAESKRKKAA
jgi:hypothetical protein